MREKRVNTATGRRIERMKTVTVAGDERKNSEHVNIYTVQMKEHKNSSQLYLISKTHLTNISPSYLPLITQVRKDNPQAYLILAFQTQTHTSDFTFTLVLHQHAHTAHGSMSSLQRCSSPAETSWSRSAEGGRRGWAGASPCP